ncbi:MAG TPA: hypothetical protein VH278_14675 [Burkholderiaceae bacterium]|jgi:hypothetical protein|nr:hypothetical protein [Burkholderiaceae bacterium]
MIPSSTVARLALSAVVLCRLSRVAMAEPFPGAREADVEVGNGVRIHDLLADLVKRCS